MNQTIYFKGSVADFAALIQALMAAGIAFTTKVYGDLSAGAEITLTGY
jgi:hypothetical protein